MINEFTGADEERCCCGRIREFTETIRINNTVHERLGDEGSFCGPVDRHIIRDQDKEIARLTLEVEQLRRSD
jgi:hypothetical protein